VNRWHRQRKHMLQVITTEKHWVFEASLHAILHFQAR